MDLERAKEICNEVAAQRKRWGRHAGFHPHSDWEVLDALVLISEEGLFDREDQHDDLVLANRQKGMAEARATKYKKELDELKKQLQELDKQAESKKDEPKKWFK